MALTEQFQHWFNQRSREAEAATFSFVTSTNHSAYLDVETDMKMARVTLWDFGSCDLEAIDADSGAQVFWKTYTFSDWDAARQVIEEFVKGVLNNSID